MRRKSTRNATKASPEKAVETTSTRRSRRHSKRRKRSSSRSSSEGSDDVSLKTVAQQMAEVPAEEVPNINLPGEEDTEQPIWKVKQSAAPSGEIQKIKICLTRPAPASPDKAEPSGRRRRNKSGSSQIDEDIASPEDKTPRKAKHRSSPGEANVEELEEQSEDTEDKKGKGKSKTKHKSKSEKTPKIQDIEDQTQSEISENVQVTPQSPQATIDNRVDNESVSTIEHETVSSDKTDANSILHNANAGARSGSSDRNVAEEVTEKQDQPQPTAEDSDSAKPQSDVCDAQVEGGFKGFDASTQKLSNPKEQIESVVEEKAVQEEPEPEQAEVQVVEPLKPEIIVNEDAVQKTDGKDTEMQEICPTSTKPEVVLQSKADKDMEIQKVCQESASLAEPEIGKQSKDYKDNQMQEISEESNSPAKPEVVQNKDDQDSEMQEVCREPTSPDKLEKEKMDPESDAQSGTEEMQISEDNKPEQEHNEEEHTTEVISESTRIEKLHQPPLRRESTTECSSSEEPEVVQQKEEPDEQVESQSSPVQNKEESSTMEEPQPSDEDSRSGDVIIIDNSLTPNKEESSFNLTQSFSPDVREIVEANQELQSMKDAIRELFPTPPSVKRRRKWGNSSVGLELLKPSLKIIDVDSIKQFCPDLQLLEEKALKMEIREVRDRRKSSSEQKDKKIDRKVSIEHQSNDAEHKILETQDSVNSPEMEEVNEPEVDNSNIIAMNRKISIVDDTASKLKPPPSPAKNPVSEVLYITNLVRPFTLKQLKELLERTGKLKENGFWTDRIKSKCYVYYETIEEAEATRNALHGVHWPIGNGKKLIIDYATPEDLEKARNPAPAPPVIPEEKVPEKENQVPPKKHKADEPEKVVKERERHRSETHVREWDIGKEDLHNIKSRSREREGRNERNDRRKHRRSPSPVDDFITRKQKKKEEDIPQKLMDDLFRKTKITPSIYWLPLTPEEIATKQQQRLLRMAEHKRRMEESSRGRGDYGRGAPPYRRRYD